MSRLRTVLVILILSGSGCATTQPPYNPFKIPEGEFRGRVKTIALSPLVIPDGAERPDEIKSKFGKLVQAKLRTCGFTVVPSTEYTAVWKRMTEQLGGYFDPVTGKKDDEKFKTVRTHSLREMNSKFKADAVLHSSVRIVQAGFSGNTAHWDGASEPLLTGSGLQKFFAGTMHGTVAALSFSVYVEDTNEVALYVDAGGIQVLSKLEGRSFVPVPKSELLTNDELNATAVDLALARLSTCPTATGAPAAKP